MDVLDILKAEVKGSVDFFLQYSNLNTGSKGYGLTVDSSKRTQICSIASIGYALTAWVIAAERGFISCQRARDITRGTFETLYERASHYRGFFAHMLDMETAGLWKKSEYSTIDTAICLNGVITADAYFQDPEIHDLAQKLLERVDWSWLIFERGGKTLFRMAYNPDERGDYVDGEPGFISQWDMAGEQKMMYLQAANHIDPHLAVRLYEGFSRDTGSYGEQKIIVIPNGSLYGYHCSEAWLDVRKYIDRDGIDWFQNVRLAALASRSFCLENSSRYNTYQNNCWGLSSGDSPTGYDVFGSTPCRGQPWHNGTVSIWGALASLPFIPEQTLEMVNYLYDCHPQTWGPYGFYDAFNLDVDPPWYSRAFYGIDKGCSMIMVENYLTGLIWDVYTCSPYIQNALGILGFQQRTGVNNGSVFSKG